MAAGFWPASPPIAYVNFLTRQHDVVRRNSDIPKPQHASVCRVELCETIGKVERNVKTLAVAGHSDSSGDLGFAQPRVDGRQRDSEQTLYPTGDFNTEDFDAAIHIRQVNARAIRRKNQASKTKLAFQIRLENSL